MFKSIGLQLGEYIAAYRHKEKEKANMNKQLRKLNQIKGVKVLLVEDDELNAQLCSEILEEEGAIVNWVRNGQEAVNHVLAMKALEYEVVLMDIQMPVMDGYAATQKIRSRYPYKKLPIIGMTADSLDAILDKVKEVGMNTCLTKPLEVDKLLQSIKENSQRRFSDEERSTKQLPQIDAVVKILSFDSLYGINVEIGLHHANHKPELFMRILEKFYDNQSDMHERMKRYIELASVDELTRYVHTTKGVCATIGAQYLSSLVATIEEQLLMHKTINPSILVELEHEMRRVLKGLESVIGVK